MISSDERYPEFFKVFLPHLCSKNMKIPDAFLGNLRKKMPQKVVLRSRFGELWPVELAETEGGLFIQGGWSRLVLDNSLQPGDFLVFKYNGHHLFDIKIFGPSGCEKEQVCSYARQEKSMMTDEDDDQQKEERYEQEQQRKARRQSRVLEGEEIEERNENKTRNTGKRQLREQIGRSTRFEKLGGRGANCSFSGYHPRNLERGITPQRLPLKNPFFVTTRNTWPFSQLTIPYDIREEFGLKFEKKICLQDPKGRTWEGIAVPWKDGRVVIKDALKKLCQWNAISEDDTLVFEVMPSNNQISKVIKVHIC